MNLDYPVIYFELNPSYDLTVSLQKLFTFGQKEKMIKLMTETGFSDESKGFMHQPYLKEYLVHMPYFYFILLAQTIYVVNYLFLYICMRRDCPPECIRRDLTKYPWSQREHIWPSKIGVGAGLVFIFLVILGIEQISDVDYKYRRMECSSNGFINHIEKGTSYSEYQFSGFEQLLDGLSILQDEYTAYLNDLNTSF